MPVVTGLGEGRKLMRTVFVGTNSKYIHTALGLRYINEYMKENGLETELVEVTANEPVLTVLARLTAVAMTSDHKASGVEKDGSGLVFGLEVHIWNRDYVLELAGLLRKVLPRCVILLGGPEVMFRPVETLEKVTAADMIVCGEGEESVLNLLRHLEAGGSVIPGCPEEEIPGIACRRDDGSIAAPAVPTVVEDLDILPFPYPDLEQVLADHKIPYYECTRGCPFHCAYCLSGISHQVRRRSLPLVLADLDRFIAAGVPLLKFVDRTYNLDESYFLPIMEHLAAADTDATFHFEIKADILSPRVLDFLKTVPPGRFQLEIGVQTTNPEVLRVIGRQDHWDRLAANVKELLAAGNMHIHMDLIAGLPLEDMASFGRSFNDVYGLRPHMLQLGFLKVLPGTVMEKGTERYGLVYMDRTPYEILSTGVVSYEEMRFLKVLENVFDLTGNSGNFPFSINYWEKRYEGDVFRFFTDLTRLYLERGMFGVGHNVLAVAELLHRFAELRGVEEEFREVLRLDLFWKQPRVKAPWLGWNTERNYERTTAFWRDEEKVRRYLPDFTFKNWRTLHQNYALEEFRIDPETLEKKKTYFLADYQKKRLTRIKTDDII